MLKFNTFRGRITAIDVTDLPTRAADITGSVERQVVADLAAALGGEWDVFRMSGAWFVKRDNQIVAGDQARGQRRRAKLEAALQDATGLAITRDVPLKR